MKRFLLVTFAFIILESPSWATLHLISANSSGDQGVYRLELQFDQAVNQETIGFQFVGSQLVMTIPEAQIKKNLSFEQPSVDYIKSLQLGSSTGKNIAATISFKDLTALQFKENLAFESLGNGVVLEILPPLLKDAPKLETPTQIGDSQSPNSSVEQNKGAGGPSKNLDENEIPLFQKKAQSQEADSDITKIILTVFCLIGLGGALIWWIKNKTKTVNGPESLMKIKMITQFHLGPKKSLAVIRVAGESLLLGITENDIRLIKTLSLLDEDLPEITGDPFGQVLSNNVDSEKSTSGRSFYKSSKNTSASIEEGDQNMESVLEEDFSFGPAVKTSLSQKIPFLRKLV